MRMPKLYSGDDHSPYIADASVHESRVAICSALMMEGGKDYASRPDVLAAGVAWFRQYRCVFTHARDYPLAYGIPEFRPPYAEIIEALTGFRAVHNHGRLGYHWKTEGVRPVVVGDFGHTWYYQRDLLRVADRCAQCDRIAVRRHWCWICRRDGVVLCSEACHERAAGVCCVCGSQMSWTWFRSGNQEYHYPKKAGCTRKCRGFESSKLFARLHTKEVRRWWGHSSRPVCSPACHDVVAAEYRQITLDLKETREWVSQGKQLLVEMDRVLADVTGQPLRRRRGRSPSPKTGSTPPQSSAAS